MKYDDRIDAVILAGTHRNPKRLVFGKNKSFLPMHDKPIVCHVIDALIASPHINTVVLVGPQEQIEKELAKCERKFIAVPERGSLLQNAWVGYQALIEREAEFVDLKLIRHLLGGELPQLKPFTPLKQRFELIALLARAAAREESTAIPFYTIERLVDDYCIAKRRHGLPLSSRRQEDMIRELIEDARVFIRDENTVRFRHESIAHYFLMLGNWIDKLVLYVSGDIPLIIPEAITDFIERCRPFTFDFYFGMTERRDLAPYQPDHNRNGIVRPLMEFHEYCARAANINLIKPKKIGNATIIQQGFTVRKLKEWHNVLKLMKILYRVPGGFKAVRFVALFQLARMLSQYGQEWLSRQIRRLLPVYKIEALATRIVNADCTIRLSPFGGLSLDIDTESDCRIITEQFYRWREVQYQIAQKIGIKA